MYPILILRAEVVCLVILIFLRYTSRSYQIDSETKSFKRLLFWAAVHVCFDIATVLTVNRTQTVPRWLNDGCHVIFYMSAILFSNEIVNYVIALCYPKSTRKCYIVGLILTAVYFFSLPVLKMSYVEDLGTYSSTGPAAFVGFGLAFLFFIAALVIIFRNLEKMPLSIKNALIPMMIVLIVVEVGQIFWRSLLFTGCAITIVTVGFFFSLENPVEVFKRKAMTDALTGVRSRSSYEEDIEELDKRFRTSPDDRYIFVFCDINDLRSVNNRFGHSEGDNYISLIAAALNKCMAHAAAVYRIGGDEFLIVYEAADEATVEKEIRALQAECAASAGALPYTPAIAAGYARSSVNHRSLKDVVKTADYAMYKNKAALKQNIAASAALGAKLNYAGLTGKTFDAMCTSNAGNYPFITNLETDVTRISPAWSEFFGLNGEFFENFMDIWKERIHPDYKEGYLEDIASVINGHKKYHNYEYLARRGDGSYVSVSCHGAIYRDNAEGGSFFTGYMVNHGVEDNTDKVSGLRNFEALTSSVCLLMDEEKPFALLKLKLVNFGRVNMLYGYSSGDRIIQKIAETLRAELGDSGEVFCNNAVNFTILFGHDDAEQIENYYNLISSRLARGVETGVGTIPVILSGGALLNHGEHLRVQDMRRTLVYVLEESIYFRRNKLVIYGYHNEKITNADFSLLSEIHRDALSEMKYFQLQYQPIVDVASWKTVGAEALLRWIHPVHGEIAPGKFIAFLENDPCYYRLGLGILNQAVKDAVEIRKKIPAFRMNVNITVLQLQNECFVEHVLGILGKYQLAPEGLCLELTERCKEMDSSFLAAKIAELRSKGIRVAFDDLGTGYSTINLLMDIPVDEIKLDRNFVRDLKSRESYQLFVRSLVLGTTSEENNYTICFEGIETEEMVNYVRGFGDYLAQGYFFARSLSIEEFVSRLEREIGKGPEGEGRA